MNLFIDTEFNGFNGKLLSMALIPEDLRITAFYAILPQPHYYDPWVLENVVPVFGQGALMSMEQFQDNLEAYLKMIGSDVTIIADWPEDIKHFFESTIKGPGICIALPKIITAVVDRRLHSSDSIVPHNAFEDARAIRHMYVELQKETV